MLTGTAVRGQNWREHCGNFAVKFPTKLLGALTALLIGLSAIGGAQAETTMLNVSYDPTRELYQDINKTFSAHWKADHNEDVTVRASHGGSGAQARAVIDGLDADVVTLGLAADIDAISDKAHLIPADWQKRLPNNATPFTSTIVFLVRKGNPKGIHDWPDLVKPGVEVITPNPKTSGGARWNFLAAWGTALKANGGDETKAKAFVEQLYQHVPVLDTGARGSTITFSQRRQGDVLISWENDALLAADQQKADGLEVVIPPQSILAEPPVSLVDSVVDRRGTRKVAEAYLQFLYTPEAQDIAAQHGFRPILPDVAAKYASKFPKIPMFSIADLGGWKVAQAKFFADGGVFDTIYHPGQ
jgi:sulfate transport system substrate-binding protein